MPQNALALAMKVYGPKVRVQLMHAGEYQLWSAILDNGPFDSMVACGKTYQQLCAALRYEGRKLGKKA